MALNIVARVIITALVLVLGLSIFAFYSHPSLLPDFALPLSYTEEEHDLSPRFNASLHRKLFSLSTRDRRYFRIDWGEFRGYNPSIISHPNESGVYLVSAQKTETSEDVVNSVELLCKAKFDDGVLKCIETPFPAPVELTEGHCEGDVEYFNLRQGPRDARVFYGLSRSYIIYGSLATRSCLGMFVQDLGAIVDGFDEEIGPEQDHLFADGTEMQRTPPYALMQKNWFLFWDDSDNVYVHQDIYPQRSFTQIYANGSVGRDLSLDSKEHDQACIAAYWPRLATENESVHQATNSLAVTLCKRLDNDCTPNDGNTFIMSIFQHQTFYSWHAQYYPYVTLFRSSTPFSLHATTRRSLWIHGKKVITNTTESVLLNGAVPKDQDELFYMTSINWKNQGQYYHGYIDDTLLLGFGIEDTNSGGIDILAGDLLEDVSFCEELVL
jgi:hypothetical protein